VDEVLEKMEEDSEEDPEKELEKGSKHIEISNSNPK